MKAFPGGEPPAIDYSKLNEFETIRQKIWELERQSREIQEQNKLIRLENRQMYLEQKMLKEETRILNEKNGCKCEKEDPNFFNYFMMNEDDQEHSQSRNLLNKVIWNNDFIKLSVNKKFIILISPTGNKDADRLIKNRIGKKESSSLGQPRPPGASLLEKLGDGIMFNHVIPFLTMGEIERVKALSKRTRKRVHPNMKFSLINKFEKSILFDKYIKHHLVNREFQAQLQAFIKKQRNYCLQFLLKFKVDSILELSFDDRVGKDAQLFCICFLKFFFGPGLKLEKINDYIFLYWSEYFDLFKTLVNFIQKNASGLAAMSLVFSLAGVPDSKSRFQSILREEEFDPATASEINIATKLGLGRHFQSEDDYEIYTKNFTHCTEFELITKELSPVHLLQVLFLRTVAKQLQVVECLRRKLKRLETIIAETKQRIDSMHREEINLELFKNFMTQYIQEKFHIAKECEDLQNFHKKLQDMTVHAMTILQHLKNNSEKDFFLIDVFLNFPREVLESGRSRKQVVDSSLSMIQAVHKLKRFDSVIDFDLFYELIHSKIFELIKKNNEEIRQNEIIKLENTKKIQEIEQKILQNEEKIHGNR